MKDRNWNKTDRDYPKDKTIYQLFQEQVEKTPNDIAIVFEDKKLTYRELNERANQLARYIRKLYQAKTQIALPADTLITLCVDRGLDMIIAILGTLKAGGAYVPVDPSYPEERIKYILQDTQSQIVLTQTHLKDKLTAILDDRATKRDESGNENPNIQTSAQFITLDDKPYQEEKITNLTQYSRSTDLAYVIYTSGTTGKPKGVMVEHKEYIFYHTHFINLYDNFVRTKENISCLFTMSYCFDASAPTLFSPILTGGLLIITRDLLEYSPDEYLSIMEKYKINILRMTPSILLNMVDKINEYSNTVLLVLGGEVLEYSSVKKIINNPRVRLINQYGPTECIVGSTNYRVDKKFTYQQIIGKAYAGKRLYVLNDKKHPVPIGIIGELYIGGAGLARGYLNCPELTKERFIENPFVTEEDTKKGYTRLYKTGDLVRWLPDGNLEYIGRNDFQVKIRGFRIELGEIEYTLSSHPDVKHVVVLVKEHINDKGITHKYLIAYYVSDKDIAEDVLIDYLNQSLPDYMIPSAFVKIESFPLTPNGKLDRNALLDPKFDTSEDNYVPPSTELECKACQIWQEVLGLERVGIKDDFFRIGGDSILSLQLTARLHKAGYECSVKDIFDYRTVEQLAKYLVFERASIEIHAEQSLLKGAFDLLPIQSGFFDKVEVQQFKSYHYWNQSFLVKVPELDREKLQSCIAQLVAYHDMLRVSYQRGVSTREADVPCKLPYQQIYHSTIAFPELKTLDVSKLNAQAQTKILTEWQNHFNIETGPLWQIGYLYGYKDNSARIYFALHHLIVDTVSWRILIEDIKRLYEGESLSVKTSSYRQWVETIKMYAKAHQSELAYWETQVAQRPDCRRYKDNVKDDSTTPYMQSHFTLDKHTTKQLLRQANQAYHTEINDLLLTALAYTLRDWQGESIQMITLEGHGREAINPHIDTSRTVGWFTTQYPVRLEVKSALSDSIKHIKESLRAIPNKGIGYGALACQQGNNLTKYGLPPINFNYLGQFDTQEGIWQLASESSGISMHSDNQNHNLINITGIVVEGQLRFSIDTIFDKTTTEKITKNLKFQLTRIIDHCLFKIKNNQLEYTFSDFNDYEPYVNINAYNNKSHPLFFFPPASGGAESYYNNLVPRISENQLVLFNNFYLHLCEKLGRESVHHYTYESLATQYIILIKKMQPTGPYNLLGWSFGGVLALEVARQLTASGDKVQHIIFIDSRFNYRKAMSNKSPDFPSINKTMSDNINYKYDLSNDPLKTDARIFLFKATQRHGEKYETDSYYINNTLDNHLGDFVISKNINVVALQSSHVGWVNCEEDMKRIVEVLRKYSVGDIKL